MATKAGYISHRSRLLCVKDATASIVLMEQSQSIRRFDRV